MSTRPLRAVSAALLSLGLFVSAGSAYAYDASIPYQNQPGYVCYRSANGGCTEWSTNGGVYGTIYYGSAAQAQPAIRCGNSRIDCTGSVSVSVTGSPNPVRSGDAVTYRIYVRNEDSQLRTLNIRAYLDPYTTFQSATFGGEKEGNIVVWDNEQIPARQSRTYSVQVRVITSASVGRSLLFRADADGRSDSVSTTVTPSDSYYYGYRAPVSYAENVYTRPTHYYERPSTRTGYPSSYYPPANYVYPTVNYYGGSYYQGTVVPSNYSYYPSYRDNDYDSDVYYYDSNGRLHYRANGGRNGGATYYCDASRYVCSY